jgi:C4-dicarboxylate transporter
LDANRLSQGQLVAAISAVALFIISFLPWFGISGGVVVQGVGAVGGSENFSLWEAENPLDIYLLIVILVALVPALLALAGGGGDAPLAPFATALLGGVGTLLILYQVFDTPGDLDRKVGLFLGLIACAGIAVGGYLSMQEDVGGERY